jgi:hypothetical protein
VSPLTQKELDRMHCDAPGCDHTSHGGPMVLHGRCHPSAGTVCAYQNGVAEVRCHDCGRLIAKLAVDPGDVVRH